MKTMNKTPKLIFLVAVLSSIGSTAFSQKIKNEAKATFKVSGNCGMCEKTIEGAANKKGVVNAQWDEGSKLLTVNYNSKKTTPDEILKRVAYAGYDNEKYLAPDKAYAKLPGCCKYERTKKEHAEGSGTQQQTNSSEEKEGQLETPYSKYFELKNALIDGDAESASAKAKGFYEAMEKVKMEKLDTKEHTSFMKFQPGLKTDAEHIAKSKDIEHQRGHFASLSKNLFELMKDSKPSYPVYLDFCPMYNDGKGATWISKENAIKNPYYGSKMLTCGKVQETIK